MKKDLVMGWVFIALALLMVFCVVVNCVNANWAGLPICGFAFGLNLMNAVNRFRDYKMRKEYEESWARFNEGFQACWPDEDDDDPKDTAGTLSSGSFIDD